ncbi:MAG: hypothetical protein ACRD4W_05720 [Nitrososphaeraceae archaeon]
MKNRFEDEIDLISMGLCIVRTRTTPVAYTPKYMTVFKVIAG